MTLRECTGTRDGETPVPTPDRLEILAILLGCGMLTLALTLAFAALLSGFTRNIEPDNDR